MGQSVKQFLDKDSISKFEETSESRYNEKVESSIYELTFVCKDKTRIITRVSGRIIYDNKNEIAGSFAILSDITAKKIFSAFRPHWRPYDGFDEAGNCTKNCRSPHTDHVHFSFNVPGGAGKTSFYKWLGGGSQPEVEPPVPPPIPLAKVSTSYAPLLISFAIGFFGF